MNQLFELLFDNIGFLIFLFFLAAPFLGKILKGAGTPPGTRPSANRMPTFGGEETDPKEEQRKEQERKAAIRAAQRQYEEEQRRFRDSDSPSDGEGRRTVSVPAAATAATGSVRSGKPSGFRSPVTGEQADPAVESGIRVEEEDLARGIVWAEILGPPRAKRPYRR